MQHEQFVGQVQHRARLASVGQAEAAIRATLETLGECVDERAATHLAAQLPPEIGRHLIGQKFNRAARQEFFDRVKAREGIDGMKSRFHARLVIDVLLDAVDQGAIEHLAQQLPAEFDELLLVNSIQQHRFPI